MKSTAEETKMMKKHLDITLVQFVLYLFTPEERTEQLSNRKAAHPLQWLCRYEGTIKTIIWYFLSVLLSMGISKLH
jgi:hypothetical protein